VWIEFALMIEEKQYVLPLPPHLVLIFWLRIEIQQRQRQFGREPRDDDRHKLENLRTSLTPLLAELNRLQAAAGVFQSAQSQSIHRDDQVEEWDTIVDGLDQDAQTEPAETSPSACTSSAPTVTQVPVEHQPLCLPSNRNVTPTHNAIELSLRITQAKTHLSQLRELIAEKSVQYSDVIRAAPRKGVRTRARGTVKGMNMRIAFHCQVYTHCQSRLVLLGAGDATLQQFRELKKDDIRASTAILTPNIPGSTTLQLSWIWHDVARHILPGADADLSSNNAATILECM